MDFISVFLISFVCSLFTLYFYDKYKTSKQELELSEQLEEHFEELRKRIIHTELVFEDKTILLYNKDTNEFLAQASTWDELNELLTERFPNYYFHLDNEIIKKAKLFNK